MAARGVSLPLRTALMRELLEVTAEIHYEDLKTTGIEMLRVGKQREGSAGTSSSKTSSVKRRCVEVNGFMIGEEFDVLGGRRFHHAAWAEDVILVAKNRAELQETLHDNTMAFERAGLGFKMATARTGACPLRARQNVLTQLIMIFSERL